MNLSMARDIAEEWVEVLKPTCDRIEIAGSVRRQKPEVHDIEIVAVPRVMTEVDMFGQVVDETYPLEGALDIMEGEGSFQVLKNGHKYKQLRLPQGINLDLFLVTPPAQWGVVFLIRTGPADFSRWMVTRGAGGALPLEYYVKDGSIQLAADAGTAKPTIIDTPEEVDYFRLCHMDWIPPEQRRPQWGRKA